MRISKYQGLGNDFLATSEKDFEDVGIEFTKENVIDIAIKACDRKFGIGADSLVILVDPSKDRKVFERLISNETADCGMYLINQDGSMADMSGNGIRCFAAYAYEQGYGSVDKKKVTVKIATLAGMKTVSFLPEKSGGFLGKVNMGKPIFEPLLIPVNCGTSTLKIEVLGKQRISYAVNTSIPHWVIVLDSKEELNNEDLSTIGEKLRFDSRFPENTNVNFVYVENTSLVYGRTIERGVGETLACGTGITAMVATLHNEDIVNEVCEVSVKGGSAKVEIDRKKDTAFLYGPMKKIADTNFTV